MFNINRLKYFTTLVRSKCTIVRKTCNLQRTASTCHQHNNRLLSTLLLSTDKLNSYCAFGVSTRLDSTQCRRYKSRMSATWSMGPGTYEVPLRLFAKNRQRLAEKLQKGQVVVLQGGEDISHYDTDVQYVFRQASALYFVIFLFVYFVTWYFIVIYILCT